ncbi:hypothetical protein M8A51_07855 [Schlegelella sp. S2-27]|uniref:Uncharacterized protein n=1 Tax=Caldimonas mangrovi TaxID=2944811 RepID=A0ABT0YNI5_9BURK|nr:hypothetical protein [Caldimonas mangrovi]MCM5679443.1 hypothetical protein [Caldimonas mangrovi]
MKRLIAAVSLLGLCAATLAQNRSASAPPPDVQTLYETLMDATIHNKVERFHDACDESVRAAVTPEALGRVSGSVQPVLAPGYDTDYLGNYRKTGLDVHLYRVDPSAGEDDLLVMLAVRDGKCAGFLMR